METVLILVLMEDTLWVDSEVLKVYHSVVLILVLMEDTLWAVVRNPKNNNLLS